MRLIRHILCVTLAAVLLAGCASTPDSGALFLLDQPGDTTTTETAAPASTDTTVTLTQLELSPYLTRDGIVYQTGPNRIVVASKNRWAAPLESQLADGLYDALDRGLARADVRRAGQVAASPSGFDLAVHVERFQGRYDGNAIISGSWRLYDAKGQVAGRGEFAQITPLQTDGYAALVRALSQGWQQVKQSLVRGVAAALQAQ